MSRSLACSSSSLCAASLALILAGCPGGAIDGDAGSDAGTPDDAGGIADAGDVDSGAPEDAGPDPSDGGNGDAGCAIVDPCEGIAVTGAVRFEQGASDTSLFGPGVASLTVGQSTRSDVDAAFGAPIASENPFRSWHCSHGVRVEYVDDVSGGAFEGSATAADVVARVVTLFGVDLSSSNGVTPGQSRTDAQAALSDETSVDLEVGGFDASASDGMSVVSDEAGIVTTVALFKPQAAGRWDLAVDVAGAAIGATPTRLARGDYLAEADVALGTGYDAQAIVTVEVSGIELDFLVRIYAGFGVRVVASCPLFGGTCDASTASVQQIILSPPFVGRTAAGTGIGSVEADFVTAYGAGQPSSESEDLVQYTGTGGRALGVAYLRDSACERRAAALLLNYTEPS